MKGISAALGLRERVDDTAAGDSVDARMVALMRCLLAFSALAIIYVDPEEPARLVALTYASLVGYFLYSLALLATTFRGRSLVGARLQPWVDVLFYAWLIGLTEGTDSIFFFFFFFVVLVASFSRGFAEGFRVTSISVLLFLAVGLAATPEAAQLELSRTLIRPVYLLVIGYMMAYWGGHEVALRRRLRLLKEVGELTNPRYSLNHAIGQNLQRLVEFFGADACLLVSATASGTASLYRVDAGGAGMVVRALTDAAAAELLGLPASVAILYPSTPRGWLRRDPGHAAWDAASGRMAMVSPEKCRRIANLLEVRSFASVPYGQTVGLPGRFYLLGGEGMFTPSDTEFLAQVAEQIAAAVEHLMLLEHLMQNAARLERTRISRDIHDTAVQPFIGLNLGLEALRRKLDPASPLARPMKELVDMTVLAVKDLREYISGLRLGDDGWRAEDLVERLREHGSRFRRFYGIAVDIEADAGLRIGGREAAEAYQAVCEALSNVYRHTSAKRAYIRLRQEGIAFAVEVGNPRDAGAGTDAFVPRSLAERARAIGGELLVTRDRGGYDVVRFTVPSAMG
jgi:signal transduction histidine kinase